MYACARHPNRIYYLHHCPSIMFLSLLGSNQILLLSHPLTKNTILSLTASQQLGYQGNYYSSVL